MTTNPQQQSEIDYDAPISTVVDLVNYALCEDNDSDGVVYLRGMASVLNGGAPSDYQVALTYNLMQWDMLINPFFAQVANKQGIHPLLVVRRLLIRLSHIYKEKSSE